MGTMDTSSTTRRMTLDNYGDLLTVKDLSGFLGVSEQTIYKEIRQGKFGKPLKFGRVYRIPKVYILERYFGGYRGK
jgi:excisionase family DNA binding protein